MQYHRPETPGASTHQAPCMTQPSGIRISTRLLDEMRDLMRRRHYSIHTERAYRDWVKRYVRFHGMQSRDDLRHGEEKIEAFLTHLARDRQVAASTRNQAMNALVFLYKHVLRQPLSGEINADRARRKVRIPVVLTREETARLIALMSGVHQLIVMLLYGSGLRITECLRLRVRVKARRASPATLASARKGHAGMGLRRDFDSPGVQSKRFRGACSCLAGIAGASLDRPTDSGRREVAYRSDVNESPGCRRSAAEPRSPAPTAYRR